MKSTLLLGPTLALALALTGCNGTVPSAPAETASIELPPPETFTWIGGQPIAFSPPPGIWGRSRYQNGGAEGVDFVKAGSKGEQILVAERFFLGKRDRCEELQKILRDLDDLNRRKFARALQKARPYAAEPLADHEVHAVDYVNSALDRAREAFLRDDRFIAGVELGRALERAGRIRYTVEETVDGVPFTAERNTVYPALRVEDPVPGEVAGLPALVVQFTFDGHGLPMIGRKIYTVRNNRMFEIGYQGLEENLPLFEAVVASITFPPGSCEH